jgi:iron complex transport system permease protein
MMPHVNERSQLIVSAHMQIIRLELDSLTENGQISPEEAVRLKAFALPDQKRGLLVNLLLIFGALSVAAGTIALVPNAATGLVLALLALGGAGTLRRLDVDASVKVLGAGLTLMGAAGLAGWIGWEFRDADASLYPTLAIAAVLAATTVWFRSAFLAGPAVLALGATLGAGTGYWHASYGIFVEEPTLTILLFSAIAAGLFALRGQIARAHEGVRTIAARTALFMVNFAFWVGSLWGDRIGEHWLAPSAWSERSEWREAAMEIPDTVFTLGWAAFLIATIVKARRGGFVSVTSIVFLAIHGYTQYFELLGANAASLVVGGIVLVGLAVAGARFFRAGPA